MANKKARKNSDIGLMEEAAADRLSDLPDHLIHIILSFLDIKYAIQSCILSKRWTRLWASNPDLRFLHSYISKLSIDDYARFVCKVLKRRDSRSNVVKFEFYCERNLGCSFVDRILNYLVSHNVQHLSLNFGIKKAIRSFRPLSRCNTLKTLELTDFSFKGLPHQSFSFGFTMLASLTLSWCGFYYSTDPFADCPNLKYLSFRNCSFPFNLINFIVSGPQLLHLEIRGLSFYSRGGRRKINRPFKIKLKIEIFAPKLVSLSYKDSHALDFSGLHLPAIDCVDIHVSQLPSGMRKRGKLIEKETMNQNLINMLQGLHNAKSVNLHSETIEVLDLVPDLLKQQPSPFKRLKSLKVKGTSNSSPLPAYVMNYLVGGTPHPEAIQVDYLKVQA